MGAYGFVTNEDQAQFIVRFVVTVTPSGNAGTDWSALATACTAVEAALRQRYQKLSVDWGGSNQETFDPAVNASTGFSAEPELEKLRDTDFPQSGYARAYEFRVRIGQPPNYTDAFGAAAGRRQVDVAFSYDYNQRLVVTMSGEWTQVGGSPGKLGRDQFLAIFNGASGYAAYRLSKVNTSEASGATWTYASREESDPNDLSVLRFRYRFEQHLNGRRGSVPDVFTAPSGQRTVTIRGTYLRTIAGGGGTYGNVYGSAADAPTNFLDATNGGQAYAEAVELQDTNLVGSPALIVTGQTGQTNCELVQKPTISTNEQKDRTDYTLVYRELLVQQSNSVGGAGYLDDPNVIQDSIRLAVLFEPLNDSPVPAPASSVPGPTSGGVSGASGSGTQGTQERPGTGSAPIPQAVTPGTASGNQNANVSTPAAKPVTLRVSYDAWFKKSVTGLYNYWNTNVYPLLLAKLSAQFGFTFNELPAEGMNPEITNNHVLAEFTVRSYQNGDVILFTFDLALFNDLGIRVDPAFTGNAHEYLVQQALPRSTMVRKFKALTKAGASFTLDQFVTPTTLQGPAWIPLSNAKPNVSTKVHGIPNLQVATQPLTYSEFEESLIWVARNVGQAASGGSNRTVTFSGLGVNQPPVAPPFPGVPVATGTGG